MNSLLNLKDGKICVDGELDKDGDLNMCIYDCGYFGGHEDIYIDKMEAILLVEHLKAVFKI